MNRLVATTVLNNYGALVFKAANGAEGVELLKCGKYDLLLMDEKMPVIDCLEATRMNDYISKPFDEEELIKIIASYLGKERRETVKGSSESKSNH